ncbi:hypothetical protein SODG_004819 [Sodalis praecaptivus]
MSFHCLCLSLYKKLYNDSEFNPLKASGVRRDRDAFRGPNAVSPCLGRSSCNNSLIDGSLPVVGMLPTLKLLSIIALYFHSYARRCRKVRGDVTRKRIAHGPSALAEHRRYTRRPLRRHGSILATRITVVMARGRGETRQQPFRYETKQTALTHKRQE